MGCVCAKNREMDEDEDPTPEVNEPSIEHSTTMETEYSYTETETEYSTTDRRATEAPPTLGGGGLGLDLFGKEDSGTKDEVEILGVRGGSRNDEFIQQSSDIFTLGEIITFVSSGGRKRCKVIRKLGDGSYGVVYEVANTLVDEVYALKVSLEQNEHQTSTEQFNDIWEQLIGQQFGDTNVEAGTVGKMSAQLMTLGTPLDTADETTKSVLFFDGALGLFDQLGNMHGTKTGSLTDGIEDGFVHLDIADRNFLIVDGKVSIIDFGLAKHASTPLLEDGKESHLTVDGKHEPKRGPQYATLITNLMLWAEANFPSFDEDDLGGGTVESKLAKNLSAKTMEALVLSGYILKNMLPEARLEVHLNNERPRKDTLFQAASKFCLGLIKKNPKDELAWQASKLANFCQNIVEDAERGPVRKDASAFLKFMTVDKRTSRPREI